MPDYEFVFIYFAEKWRKLRGFVASTWILILEPDHVNVARPFTFIAISNNGIFHNSCGYFHCIGKNSRNIHVPLHIYEHETNKSSFFGQIFIVFLMHAIVVSFWAEFYFNLLWPLMQDFYGEAKKDAPTPFQIENRYKRW